MDKELITKSTVMEMGFTKTMIDKLLPAPILKQNPHYKCAPPMKLYDKAIVEEIMKSDIYKEELAKAEKRKASANKAVETKRDKLLSIINEVSSSITVKYIEDDILVKQAIASYKEHKIEIASYYGDYERIFEIDATNDFSKEFIDRIVVNYIRHNLTSYDDNLELIYNRVGKDEAYAILKNAVLQSIATTYPKYAKECENQSL